MTVTIIIPFRNESRALPELLDSIVSQTTQPHQVVLADSHSTDNSVSIGQEYANRLPITIVTARKDSVAGGRNVALEQATGDILLFTDSDVLLPPTFVADMIAQITKRQLDVGGFRQTVLTDDVGLKIGGTLMNTYVRTMSHTPWPIFFSCFFAKREVYERIGGFDEELILMEDYDYAYRAKKAIFRFGILRQTAFLASMRRFDEHGNAPSIIKGIYAELYRYTHGLRITKPLYTYEMGGKTKEKP